MDIIKDSQALSDWCEAAKSSDILCVDTEFVRERTYFPQLCLIQLGTRDAQVIVDPIEGKDMDLSPLWELLVDESIVKILHAARQDNEIFFNLGNVLPKPLFDTQIAAMVCGYGEQVAYGTLVQKVSNVTLDKTQRFTDWARRPLKQKQLEYALADVVYLPPIYDKLTSQLQAQEREGWIEEETAKLIDADLYRPDPLGTWRRIKIRSREEGFIARVQHLAKWREETAVAKDKPRGRIIKDEAILEVAASNPKEADGVRTGRMSAQISKHSTDDIIAVLKTADEQGLLEPLPIIKRPSQHATPGAAETLRIILTMVTKECGVAPKLIASADDLQALAGGERELPCMKGWRYDLFGSKAELWLSGEMTMRLSADGPVFDRYVESAAVAD